MRVEIAGQQVTLLAERAVWWEDIRTLFIADLHLGKAASLRYQSVGIPCGTTDTDLVRLSGLLESTSAETLVILGDMLHAKHGRSETVMSAFSRWRLAHPDLEMLLVRGNHDVRSGDPPAEWNITCVDEGFALPPFVLCHHPCQTGQGYVLSGHLHPGFVVYGAGKVSEKVRCFVIGKHRMVLPAFGAFTGSKAAIYEPTDAVYCIAEDEIMKV